MAPRIRKMAPVLGMARRICVPVFVALLVVLVLVTPTCCSASRALQDGGGVPGGATSPETRILFEEGVEFEMRSSTWSDLQSGDDAVPNASSTPTDDDAAAKYHSWVRLQEDLQVTEDYGDTPAAANPSNPIPCC